MDQITPSLGVLLDLFANCFRYEVAATFRLQVTGWILCLGRRTISRVWETTAGSATDSHYPAFRMYSEAVWNWDEVCRILLLQLLVSFVPGGRIWLVVDDTLCHKRGAKVAFGGIFLDAVMSSKKHKNFRFGTNWVTLGLIIELPFRTDRFFCVNILWRIAAKKDKNKPKDKDHRTKSQLAQKMVLQVASWLPGQQLMVLGDNAYIGKHMLLGLPDNVSVIGPIHWKGKLTEPLPEDYEGKRKKGEDLTTAKDAMEDDRWAWQDLVLHHPKGKKKVQVKVVGPCCWYKSAGTRPLQVVVVRDPDKIWRDEALLCSDLSLSAEEVIVGYMRRWSVEVAYCDGKQLLGFHDPMVWSANSVTRAHPMAWFVAAVVILWYTQTGQHQPQPQRNRPWYKNKITPTFADMLACCRLHLWQNWLKNAPDQCEENLDWLLEYVATAA
jgi:hypothetical protein